MSDANRKVQLGAHAPITEPCLRLVGNAVILPATDSLPSFLGGKSSKTERVVGTAATPRVGDSQQVRELLATLSLPADDLNN